MGSYSQLTYHIVFGTKFRRNSIHPEIADQLYEYVGGTIRSQNGHLIQIGGVEDHLHLLVSLPSKLAVSDAVRVLKANASKWVNENRDNKQRRSISDKFEWQIGFGAFTVSYSQIELVRGYIQKQKEHHRTRTFEEEYIELLKRHNISFKREYLFEAEHAG